MEVDGGEAEVLGWIDTERYPLDARESPGYAAVVAAGRAQLAEHGYAELSGFVRPGAVERFVAEAEALRPRAYASEGIGTPYLELPDEAAFASDHPRRTWMPYGVSAVPYDLFPTSSLLRGLYEAEVLRVLIEDIVDRGPVMRYADPFGALNLAVMHAGDQLQWHFDQTDFVVSLAIQTASVGGDFEVAPKIRSADDERYDEVAEVLDGASSAVVTLAMTPGTLLVFEGRHSLHRVSPIEGTRARHVGLLGYDTTPGAMVSDLLREIRYGRTVPFDTPPAVWPPT